MWRFSNTCRPDFAMRLHTQRQYHTYSAYAGQDQKVRHLAPCLAPTTASVVQNPTQAPAQGPPVCMELKQKVQAGAPVAPCTVVQETTNAEGREPAPKMSSLLSMPEPAHIHMHELSNVLPCRVR